MSRRLVLALLLLAVAACAGPRPAPPSPELWALVRANQPAERLRRVLADPAVDGLVLYTSLARTAPAADRRDWGAIDEALAACRAAGKPMKLAILGGRWVPPWLYQAGAARISWTHTTALVDAGTSQASAPAPWDETYLAAMAGIAAEAGARYGADPLLAEVQVTGPALANGLEMNLELDPAAAAAAGYRRELLERAWCRMVDAWAAAFPRQRVSLAFHNHLPEGRSDALARAVAAHADGALGARFSPLVCYLTEEPWFARGNSAVDAWAGYAPARRLSAQLIDIYSVKRRPAAAAATAAARARALGAAAIEVFVDDLLDPAYRDPLAAVRAGG